MPLLTPYNEALQYHIALSAERKCQHLKHVYALTYTIQWSITTPYSIVSWKEMSTSRPYLCLTYTIPWSITVPYSIVSWKEMSTPRAYLCLYLHHTMKHYNTIKHRPLKGNVNISNIFMPLLTPYHEALQYHIASSAERTRKLLNHVNAVTLNSVWMYHDKKGPDIILPHTFISKDWWY